LDATILFLDDDSLTRTAAADALRGLGFHLHLAADVEEALAVLRETDVEVVVADHVLPGTSGLALLQSLREHLPGPKRILASASSDPGLLVSAINEAGVFRFLAKPIDANALRLAVYCAVEERRREEEARGLVALVQEGAGLGLAAAG
jgi:DNA-binding NtrC family response regulator